MANVLLVEQRERFNRMLPWVLREAGYEVTIAESADEALCAAQRLRPVAIIYDGENGGERHAGCIEALRANSPGSRILDVHLASLHQQIRTRAHPDGCVHRPFDADSLLGAIDRMLQDR